MALSCLSMFVTAKRNEGKVKEHLALLKRSDKELQALERAMALELEETLNEIRRVFISLKEFIDEKESACLRKAHEASETRIGRLRSWRIRNEQLSADLADVS